MKLFISVGAYEEGTSKCVNQAISERWCCRTWVFSGCRMCVNHTAMNYISKWQKQKKNNAILKSRLRKNIVHRLSAKSFLLFFFHPLWLVWEILTCRSEAGTAKKLNWILQRKHIAQKAFTFPFFFFTHTNTHTQPPFFPTKNGLFQICTYFSRARLFRIYNLDQFICKFRIFMTFIVFVERKKTSEWFD